MQDGLKWNCHLRDSTDNVFKSLNQRINAVKIISKFSDFKTRKMLANGIFMSKLTYLITIWSSCSKELKSTLQVLQNKAARAVTRNDWNIPNADNHKQLGWLSVNQLSFYHKVLQLQKLREFKLPANLYKMFDWEYIYSTRQACGGLIKPMGTPRLQISKKSFRWSSAECFNSLPLELRLIKDTLKFKIEAKCWIQENIQFK